MLEIPAVVQRLVFPLLVAVGNLLGKYGKYADAPVPFTRRDASVPREKRATELVS